MQVDEARQEHESVGVEALDVRGCVDRAERCDDTLSQEHVTSLGGAVRGIPRRPGEQHVAHAAAPSPARRW